MSDADVQRAYLQSLTGGNGGMLSGGKIDNANPFSTYSLSPIWRALLSESVTKEDEVKDPVEEIVAALKESEGGRGSDTIENYSSDDIRSPEFWGVGSFPGKKSGAWNSVSSKAALSDLATMMGLFSGKFGILSGMLNPTQLSTFASPAGQAGISAAAQAFGLDPSAVNKEIAAALGFSNAPSSSTSSGKTGGVLGGFVDTLSGLLGGSKNTGAPNVMGMMAGTIAGYPNTWDNKTFTNIVNERQTIAGIMDKLASAKANNMNYGSFMSSLPGTIAEFTSALSNIGIDTTQPMSGVQKAAASLDIDTIESLAKDMAAKGMNHAQIKGYLDNLVKDVYGNGGGYTGKAQTGTLDSFDAGQVAKREMGFKSSKELVNAMLEDPAVFQEYTDRKSSLMNGIENVSSTYGDVGAFGNTSSIQGLTGALKDFDAVAAALGIDVGPLGSLTRGEISRGLSGVGDPNDAGGGSKTGNGQENESPGQGQSQTGPGGASEGASRDGR